MHTGSCRKADQVAGVAKISRALAVMVAQQTVGRLPRSSSRLTGRLAINGGTPVRDIRFRPYADYHQKTVIPWLFQIGPQFRRLFRSGQEGLPQSLAGEFGRRWAEYCGVPFGLMLPHGTDALRFALAAACDHNGLEYGGEVIVPNFSFIASATIALDRRFGVRLVDVEPDTLLLDPAKVEEAVVPGKTVAIIAVHLFGQPCNMTALKKIAEKYDLRIVEDAAQAHGAEWEGTRVGGLGHAAGFSFQSHKTLNCGEGGAMTTSDPEIFDRVYSMHNVGRSRSGPGRWVHASLGWNCRPGEYQAALLLHRMSLLDRQQKTRERNVKQLRLALGEDSCLLPLAVRREVTRHGMYMFVMRYLPERCGGLEINAFLRAVQAEGMPIHRAFESTISDQPAFRVLRETNPAYVSVEQTPVADAAARNTVYIQHEFFLGTATEMDELAAAVRKVESYFRTQVAS